MKNVFLTFTLLVVPVCYASEDSSKPDVAESEVSDDEGDDSGILETLPEIESLTLDIGECETWEQFNRASEERQKRWEEMFDRAYSEFKEIGWKLYVPVQKIEASKDHRLEALLADLQKYNRSAEAGQSRVLEDLPACKPALSRILLPPNHKLLDQKSGEQLQPTSESRILIAGSGVKNLSSQDGNSSLSKEVRKNIVSKKMDLSDAFDLCTFLSKKDH